MLLPATILWSESSAFRLRYIDCLTNGMDDKECYLRLWVVEFLNEAGHPRLVGVRYSDISLARKRRTHAKGGSVTTVN